MSLNHSVIRGQCPGCLIYEEKVARLEAANVALTAALRSRGYHPPSECPLGSCSRCESALSPDEGCTCDGPPMQPCGPKCRYPYTDALEVK